MSVTPLQCSAVDGSEVTLGPTGHPLSVILPRLSFFSGGGYYRFPSGRNYGKSYAYHAPRNLLVWGMIAALGEEGARP